MEKFKYILSNKQGNARFPNDSTFLKALSNKEIYTMRAKNKQYIMERYENWGTKEVKDVYNLISNGTYTIEHIMPQNLSYEWQQALGDQWQEIHEDWVHKLANLTLTAYNSKYQNSSFQRKRDVENGYRDSGIRMNQRLANFDRWTEIELKDRNEQMVSKAEKIWPMVETYYEPENKLEEKVALSDEINLTGRLLSEFEFLGARNSVKSWQEMYLRTIELIIDDNPQLLINQINKKDSDLKYYIGNHQSTNSYKKIYDGIYINTNTSTNTKIIGLKKVFDLYDVDENELIFYLKSKD